MNHIVKFLTAGLILLFSNQLFSQNLILRYSPTTISGNVNDTILVRVIVQNFTNMQDLQFSHNWDTAKMQLVLPLSVTANMMNTTLNITPANNFGSSNPPPAANGRLAFSWATEDFDNGTNLPNTDSVLYVLRFKLKAAGPYSLCYSDIPTKIEGHRVIGGTAQNLTIETTSIGTCPIFCAQPVYTASATSPTCNGSTPNQDGKICISNVSNGNRVGYSQGNTYTGPNYDGATNIANNVSFCMVNNLSNPANPTPYTIRVFNNNNNCFKDITVTYNPASCGPACTQPGYTASATSPTCNGNTPNQDGKICIANVINGDRAGYSSGGTYNGPDYTNATVITNNSSFCLVTNLPNPGAASLYTVRVYNASNTCFRDITITYNPANCGTGCNTPVFTAAATSPTCNGLNPNTDGKICITTVFTGDRAGYSLGTTYNGPPYASATPVSPGTCLVNNLPNPGAPTQYTVRVFNGANTCFRDTIVTLQPVNCGVACVTPVFAAAATSATCNGNVANSNGKICINTVSVGDRAGYSLGNSYSGPAYSGATGITNGTCLVSNLSNPALPTQYTVRVFNGSNTCFKDTVVTLNPVTCGNTPPPVVVNIKSDSAATGQSRCLDVRVTNFTNINGIQYSLNWNATKLRFDSINIPLPSNLQDLSVTNNFGTSPNLTSNGRLTFSYDNANGVTLAPNTLIYRVCYTAIGGGGMTDTVKVTDTPLQAEATTTTTGPLNIGIAPQNGIFKITGNNPPPNSITFTGSSESGKTGDTVCVKVSVSNFTNVVGMQYSMNWDPGKLQFVNIKLPATGGLPGLQLSNFNALDASLGKLGLGGWTANNPAAGESLPNNTVIYEVCYKVLGSVGQVTNVNFGDDPIPHEIITTTSGANGVLWNPVSGKVTVVTNNTGNGLVVKGSEVTGNTGDTVCVSVTVQNFVNIIGMQFSMGWDTAVAKFVRISFPATGGLPGLGSSNFNSSPALTNAGKLGLAGWVANDPSNGESLPNGTKLFDVCLRITGSIGQMTPFLFTDDPVGHEFTDKNGANVDWNPMPGKITVGNVPGPLRATITGTNPNCFGQTGTATVNASGGTAPYTYNWGSQAGNGSNPRIGLPAGTFTVTVTDNGGNSVTASVTITVPADISISGGTVTDATGGNSNGAINGIAVTGGTSPYTYLWSNGANTLNISGLAAGSYTLTVTDSKSCTKTATFTVQNINNVPVVVTVTNKKDVTCHGGSDGSITLSVSGGNSPNFTYQWSPGTVTGQNPTGLKAGVYTVTVTNGTSATAVITISEPADISISAGITSVKCNGNSDGAISLAAIGGNGGFTYQWNPGTLTGSNPTGLRAGIYSVTATDSKGCTKATSFNLTEPADITLTSTITAVKCNGNSDGAISLALSGGTGTFTYQWAPNTVSGQNPTGLKAGTYGVTATDIRGCAKTSSITVTEPALLTLSTAVTQVKCNGAAEGAIALTTNGGNGGYTYQWNPGTVSGQNPTGLRAGNYAVTVTDAKGCTESAAVTITEPTALNVTSQVKPVTCNAGNDGEISLTVSGGVASYQFNWGTQPGNGTNIRTGLRAGTYTVTITDNNGCSVTKTETLADPPAIQFSVLSVTPAPGGSITISASGGTGTLTFSWTGPNGYTSAVQNPTNLPVDGNYMVVIRDSRGCSFTSPPIAVASVPLGLNVIVTPIRCFGDSTGRIELKTTGGIQPFTIRWSNSTSRDSTLSGLAAGTYTVSITESGKSTPTIVRTITVPSIPTARLALTVAGVQPVSTCNGTNGSISISVTGGVRPYRFLWNNGSTSRDLFNVGIGIYDVLVTDSLGCILQSNKITVGSSVPAGYTNVKVTRPKCAGDKTGALEFEVSGCAPYTVRWNGGQFVNFTNPSVRINDLMAGTYYVTITAAGATPVVDSFKIIETAPINVDGTIKDNTSLPVCNGNITLNITPPDVYDVFWQDNGSKDYVRNGLCEGPYTVTVRNSAGCVTQKTFVVKGNIQVPLTVAVAGSRDVDCPEDKTGFVKVTVSGGKPPYTFVWRDNNNNTITGRDSIGGLSAGTYFVTITDANGQVVTGGPFEVKSLSKLDGSVAVTRDAATVTVSGANGTVRYQWSDPTVGNVSSAKGLKNGNYTVTICDSKCCVVRNFTIDVCAITANIIVVKPVNCAGNSDGVAAIRNVAGCTAPYRFRWDNQVADSVNTQLNAGKHKVTVTDASGNSLEVEFTVPEPAPLNVSVLVANASCGGSANGKVEAIASGGTGTYTFEWNVAGNNAKDRIVNNLPKGIYTVLVKDANSCQRLAQGEIKEDCDSVSCFESSKIFTPNDDGVNDVLRFSLCDHTESKLQIFNRWGQLVFEDKNIDGNNAWDGKKDGDPLPEGAYFYVLEVKRGNKSEVYKGAITLLR